MLAAPAVLFVIPYSSLDVLTSVTSVHEEPFQISTAAAYPGGAVPAAAIASVEIPPMS